MSVKYIFIQSFSFDKKGSLVLIESGVNIEKSFSKFILEINKYSALFLGHYKIKFVILIMSCNVIDLFSQILILTI